MASHPAPTEPKFEPLDLEVDYEGIELRILASLGLTREQAGKLTYGMAYGDKKAMVDELHEMLAKITGS